MTKRAPHHPQKSARNLAKRKKAERAGRWAELLIGCLYLIRLYRLISWRHKTPYGEIDLIMRRGNHIRFIEVKYRTAAPNADSPVSDKQMLRLRRAALDAYHRLSPDGMAACQFDIILVTKGGKITRFENHIAL